MSKRGNLKVGFAPSDPPKGVKAVDSIVGLGFVAMGGGGGNPRTLL